MRRASAHRRGPEGKRRFFDQARGCLGTVARTRPLEPADRIRYRTWCLEGGCTGRRLCVRRRVGRLHAGLWPEGLATADTDDDHSSTAGRRTGQELPQDAIPQDRLRGDQGFYWRDQPHGHEPQEGTVPFSCDCFLVHEEGPVLSRAQGVYLGSDHGTIREL